MNEQKKALFTLEAFEIALALRNQVVSRLRETRNEHIHDALLRVISDLERTFQVLDCEEEIQG